MKEIDEARFRDEVFLAEEYRPGEFTIIDVAADRGDVLVKEFSDLAGCMEVKVDGHCSPMSFLILYKVLSWGFGVLPFRILATAECDILRNIATCWSVKSLSKTNVLNLSTSCIVSLFSIATRIIKSIMRLVKSFFKLFVFFIFL